MLVVQVLPEDSSSKGEDVVQETLQSSGSHISLRSFSEAAAATAWENLMASATGPGAVLPSPYAGLSFLETLPACDIQPDIEQMFKALLPAVDDTETLTYPRDTDQTKSTLADA